MTKLHDTVNPCWKIIYTQARNRITTRFPRLEIDERLDYFCKEIGMRCEKLYLHGLPDFAVDAIVDELVNLPVDVISLITKREELKG